MAESFPLRWPLGVKRTENGRRKPSSFKTTPGRATAELISELKRLGAKNIVISSNVATYRRAGQEIPYANQDGAREDPGVAVYYFWKEKQYAFSCDKWNAVHDNIYSIAKTINAIRGIERWGTGEAMQSAFAGFAALPDSEPAQEWWAVLGITKYASSDEIKSSYRRLVQIHHPDKGGSATMFHKINQAYKDALNASV